LSFRVIFAKNCIGKIDFSKLSLRLLMGWKVKTLVFDKIGVLIFKELDLIYSFKLYPSETA